MVKLNTLFSKVNTFLGMSLFQKRLIVPMAVLVVGLAPVLGSAAQVTERSIELSSSSVSASNVTYEVNFTSAAAAGAFIVDFCSNTPVIGEECVEPEGFTVAAATSTTSGFTNVEALDANTLRVAGEFGEGTAIAVAVAGITNPSVSGSLYARIVTYDTLSNANDYTSQVLGAGVRDSGGIAMSITPTIGVTGSVLESITFCVSGEMIQDNCTATTAPVLALGEAVGDVVALNAGSVSTGDIYTQISTNAAKGATVSLKSSATDCGGLKRVGTPTNCSILPALRGDITAGQAKFGVKTANATNTDNDSIGVFRPVNDSGYNNSTYVLNFTSGNTTGVTSTYGDPFLDTGGAPAIGKNMRLTFGASVANDTPAGSYSTEISLIATGKF